MKLFGWEPKPPENSFFFLSVGENTQNFQLLIFVWVDCAWCKCERSSENDGRRTINWYIHCACASNSCIVFFFFIGDVMPSAFWVLYIFICAAVKHVVNLKEVKTVRLMNRNQCAKAFPTQSKSCTYPQLRIFSASESLQQRLKSYKTNHIDVKIFGWRTMNGT